MGRVNVLCVSFQPNQHLRACAIFFFTDIVILYVLLICRINDKLQLGSLLSPHLESVMFAIRLGVMSSNSSRAQRSTFIGCPDDSGIAVLVAFPRWLTVESLTRLVSSISF